MPVDVGFELSYMLSDKLGRSVEVVEWSFEPNEARLCIRARLDGVEKEACITIKPCRGLTEAKAARCIVKTLTASEKLLDELAERLSGLKA